MSLEDARRHQRDRDLYREALREDERGRRQRGAALLRMRFREACRVAARRRPTVTLDAVFEELQTTVIGLTLKQTARLAAEEGLAVDWDGVMPRSDAFEDFIRDTD